MLVKALVRLRRRARSAPAAMPSAMASRRRRAAIIADYDAQSAVERELVLRLASLLWRLRRATTMETGLFEIQADHLVGLNEPRQVPPGSREVVYTLFGRAESGSSDTHPTSHDSAYETGDVPGSIPTTELARCFLRLANLPNYALDRLSRYEATFWRQAGQILFALDVLHRRKPWDRRRHLRFGNR
jgi:hypothetical protein